MDKEIITIEELRRKPIEEFTEEEKEYFCEQMLSCGVCPFGETIRVYTENFTPGNSVGRVLITEYWCELFQEEKEEWD